MNDFPDEAVLGKGKIEIQDGALLVFEKATNNDVFLEDPDFLYDDDCPAYEVVIRKCQS